MLCERLLDLASLMTLNFFKGQNETPTLVLSGASVDLELSQAPQGTFTFDVFVRPTQVVSLN